ncbi:MAG: hypothetical protein M3198_15765 [Actinomycetota bacterium]|nr:hypothetical protein [Actinomycetota bacterium]
MSYVDLDTLVLEAGKHSSPEHGMNVLEAVSLYGHREFSDRPNTVSPVIRAFLHDFNDALEDSTRQRLKDYIPKIDRSILSGDIEDFRAWQAANWMVHVMAPIWLRAAELDEPAEALEATPPILTPDAARDVQELLDQAAAAANKRAKEGTAAWNQAGEEAWATVSKTAWNTSGGGVKNMVKRATACVAQPAFSAAGAGKRYAARDAVAEAASDLAWDSAYTLAWKAAVPVGGGEPGAAAEAAREALEPTVDKLIDEAFGLLELLLETRRIPAEYKNVD